MSVVCPNRLNERSNLVKEEKVYCLAKAEVVEDEVEEEAVVDVVGRVRAASIAIKPLRTRDISETVFNG